MNRLSNRVILTNESRAIEMLPPLPAALVRRLIYPAYRAIKREGLLADLAELESMERLPLERLEEIQALRLRETLAEAYRYVPYYRDAMDRAGLRPENVHGPEDLAALPFLTKEIIRAESGRLVTTNPARKGYRSSTGGSTGEPLYFFNDHSAGPGRRANTIRTYRWAGIDIGDRQAILWGFALGRPMADRISASIKNYFNNIMPLSTFDMSEEEMSRQAARLRRFRPAYIVSYPSAISLLADFCERTGAAACQPNAVVTSGEMLFPHQREIIERVFGSEVFNRYGSREFANVAMECGRHAGLHLFIDLYCAEIVGEDGRPCAEGETGELVITDFSNLFMPFIRYRTGDLAVRTSRRCPCGRGHPLIEKIEGRTFDVIVTPSGKKVGGFFWTWLSRAVPGIHRFQIVQESPGGIVFRIVPGKGWEDGHRKTLAAKIAENCGEDFTVDFEIVEDIPLTRSGKSRFILSRL